MSVGWGGWGGLEADEEDVDVEDVDVEDEVSGELGGDGWIELGGTVDGVVDGLVGEVILSFISSSFICILSFCLSLVLVVVFRLLAPPLICYPPSFSLLPPCLLLFPSSFPWLSWCLG
jgi:hypothetical protein